MSIFGNETGEFPAYAENFLIGGEMCLLETMGLKVCIIVGIRLFLRYAKTPSFCH